MRGALPLVLSACVLAACNSTTGDGSDNIRPSATTNEAAATNLRLAVEYMQRHEYERALEKLDRARQSDPGYALTYNTYGVLYQTLGDNTRAEQNFKHALQLGGDDSATMNNYGRFLCQQNRIDEADAVFRKAASNPLYETREIPLTNAGTCMLGAKRLPEAEKYFRSALEIDPRMPAALMQMSRLTYDRGDALRARGYLQRFLEVSKPTAESLWLGIQIEEKLGDKDAVSSYTMMLRNNFPDSEQAQKLRPDSAR
jgi:type IV pilus assembly protein PilF